MPAASGAPQLVAFAIGGPLEQCAGVDGPDDDVMRGKHNTMYSVSITVAPTYQSGGIGRKLKAMQLRDAAARTRPDGSPRYRYVTGRNRVGRTAQMTHLNRVFGAHVVSILTGQYEDPEGQAIYYRIPLGAMTPDPELTRDVIDERRAADPPPAFDLASGLTSPIARPVMADHEQAGLLYGPAINKLTLMNYVTPGVVRALEHITALVPELPHVYLTSSRDETVDKALRLVRFTRKQAQVAIGLAGGYYGHTCASCRSLSDPSVHLGGPPQFDWPRLPHPAIAGTAATIEALRAAVAAAGGADKILGFVFELVQERTGHVVPADFGPALAALKTELDIPIITVETTTSHYRSGRGAFLGPALGISPDVMTWWGGAQTGYLHVAPRWYVPGPLTLVSTWDGDELSLVRQHQQLRAARKLDIAEQSKALDRALASLPAGATVHGLGGYRVIHLSGHHTGTLADRLADRGVALRRLPGHRLAVIPPLDVIAAYAAHLHGGLEKLGHAHA